MARKYKIRRYGYEWGGQRKVWWQKAIAIVMFVAVFAGIGWFAYEPVYNFVMNIGGNFKNVDLTPPTSEISSASSLPQSSLPQSSLPQSSLPESTPPTETGGFPQKVYYLSEAAVENKQQLENLLAKIKSDGGQGVMFDLKNEAGMVLYDSKLPIVTKNLSLAEQPYSLSELCKTIKDAGLVPVGRMFAFKDSTATASMTEGAVKYMNSKVSWLDNAKSNGGKAWLNPNSALSRDYIMELVEETTSAGVSHLVLDGVQFPMGLSLHLATYGGTPDKSAVLADFVKNAQQRADKNGAVIYPTVSLSAISGVDNVPYGENPEKLIAASGHAILDIRPEQFGIGITTDKLVLSKPVLEPYETTKTALDAAKDIIAAEDAELVVLVQAYTSTQVEGAANKTYGNAEVEEQIKAAAEAGLEKVICYNPSGTY